MNARLTALPDMQRRLPGAPRQRSRLHPRRTPHPPPARHHRHPTESRHNMSVITVTNQAELDAASKAGETLIIINSPVGVWLTLRTPESSHVVAWGSSHVVARGSSHVVARGSSHVEAWESSHVVARESSHVEAWGSSHVVAWESSHVVAWESSHVVAWESSHVEARESSHVEARESSHVEAWESSHVVARESSHVEAWGSSHVVARGSSHVVAWGSSHVEARESSHVEAWESSHVEAQGSSHVEATPYVAVHLHSGRAKVEGGHVMDVSNLDLTNPDTFAAYHGGPLLLADDGRGYQLGFRSGRYFAGCRNLTAEQAIAHWSNPDHPVPKSAALLLAAVQAHIATNKEITS